MNLDKKKEWMLRLRRWRFKQKQNRHKLQTFQLVVSISAILVGGWWTYENFIKERKNFPHAYVEHIISNYSLSDNTNLLSVVLKITNTGHSLMHIVDTNVRVQQVLPMLPCRNEYDESCAKNQVKVAASEIMRREDLFDWKNIAARKSSLEPPRVVEPGEIDHMDFEFVIPADVKLVRIYSYIQNERIKELGWRRLSFYQLSHGVAPADQDKREQSPPEQIQGRREPSPPEKK